MNTVRQYCKHLGLGVAIALVVTACGGSSSSDNSNTSGTGKSSDTVAPTITVVGNSSITIKQGSGYRDAGATATDNVDGNIEVTATGTVDATREGTYTITYSAVDSSGNRATATREVKVEVAPASNIKDTVPPVITPNGDNPQKVEASRTNTSAFEELNATAIDNLYGTLDSSDINVTYYDLQLGMEVNSTDITSGANDVGNKYIATYKIADRDGNVAELNRTIEIVDTTAPTLTLNGDSIAAVALGSSFTDSGATAEDDVDGDLTSSIKKTGVSGVDVNTEGTYIISYEVTDKAGNTAEITKTVIVVDSISFRGKEYKAIAYKGKTWLDRNLGANRVCTSRDDSECFGDYYQWGRNTDGHEDRANSKVRTMRIAGLDAISDVKITGNDDWLAAGIDDNKEIRLARWSAIDGSSVCPVGFRVPYKAELLEVFVKDTEDVNTLFASPFKIGATDYYKTDNTFFNANPNNGALYHRGVLWGIDPTSTNKAVYATTESGSSYTRVYPVSRPAEFRAVRCIAGN